MSRKRLRWTRPGTAHGAHEKGVERNMSMLWAMVTGKLTEEECQTARIAEFIGKGWLKSQKTKTTVTLLKVDLLCWFNLLKDTGEDNLAKNLTMTNNLKVLEHRLDRGIPNNKMAYPLQFVSKQRESTCAPCSP